MVFISFGSPCKSEVGIVPGAPLAIGMPTWPPFSAEVTLTPFTPRCQSLCDRGTNVFPLTSSNTYFSSSVHIIIMKPAHTCSTAGQPGAECLYLPRCWGSDLPEKCNFWRVLWSKWSKSFSPGWRSRVPLKPVRSPLTTMTL